MFNKLDSTKDIYFDTKKLEFTNALNSDSSLRIIANEKKISNADEFRALVEPKIRRVGLMNMKNSYEHDNYDKVAQELFDHEIIYSDVNIEGYSQGELKEIFDPKNTQKLSEHDKNILIASIDEFKALTKNTVKKDK